MKYFLSINSGFGGAEILFENIFADLRSENFIGDDWIFKNIDRRDISFIELSLILFSIRRSLVFYNMSVLGVSIWPLLLLFVLGNKIVLLPHVVVSPLVSRPKFRFLRYFFQLIALSVSFRVISISDGNFSRLIKLCSRDKIRLCYNYVRVENDRNIAARNYNREIAIIGRFQNIHKGQIDFLSCFSRFIKKYGLIIRLFGDGPDRCKIENLIQSFNLEENVFVHGWCGFDEIYNFDFSFFLNFSRWEGLPLSVLEGIYMDRVPILSNIDGNRELVSEDFVFSSLEQLESLLRSLVIEGNFTVCQLYDQKKNVFLKYNRMKSLRSYAAALTDGVS